MHHNTEFLLENNMNDITNKRLQKLESDLSDTKLDIHGLKQGMTSIHERMGSIEILIMTLGDKMDRIETRLFLNDKE